MLEKSRLTELFGLHFACRAGYQVLFRQTDRLLKILARSLADNSFDRFITPDVLRELIVE